MTRTFPDQTIVSLTAEPRDRVFDRITQFLRAEIVSGRLRPGDRLKPERELAAELQVGRGSLREALRALEMLDVVEMRHGSGVYIRMPQPDVLSKTFGTLLAMQPSDPQAVIEARIALECHAATLACESASPRDLRRIEVALGRLTSPETLTSDSGTEADHAFHTAIVEAAQNPTILFLYEAIDVLLRKGHQQRWQRLIGLTGFAELFTQVHEAIYVAISERNPSAATNAINDHFRGIQNFLSEGTAARRQKPGHR